MARRLKGVLGSWKKISKKKFQVKQGKVCKNCRTTALEYLHRDIKNLSEKTNEKNKKSSKYQHYFNNGSKGKS